MKLPKIECKDTTPVHILAGILTVLAGYFLSPVLGVILWLSFLAIEVWNKKEWETSHRDFWEFVLGVFCAAGLLLAYRLALWIW